MPLHTMQAEMTSREREEFEQEKEASHIAAQYNIKMKEMELELARLETKWSSWMKIPVTLITLPIKLVMALAYIVAMIRGKEPSEDFWKYIK